MKKIICAAVAALSLAALSAEAFTIANIASCIDRFMSGKGTCVKISYTRSGGSNYNYYLPKDKVAGFYYRKDSDGDIDLSIAMNGTSINAHSYDVNDISLDAAGNLIITKK